MTNQGCDIGMIGLGVMGRNLVLNIVDHGFSVAGYDGNAEKSGELMRKATGGGRIRGVQEEQGPVGPGTGTVTTSTSSAAGSTAKARAPASAMGLMTRAATGPPASLAL